MSSQKRKKKTSKESLGKLGSVSQNVLVVGSCLHFKRQVHTPFWCHMISYREEVKAGGCKASVSVKTWSTFPESVCQSLSDREQGHLGDENPKLLPNMAWESTVSYEWESAKAEFSKAGRILQAAGMHAAKPMIVWLQRSNSLRGGSKRKWEEGKVSMFEGRKLKLASTQ